jgi:ubiquinone/menaquinone biosynthesis C-methylase UbiE
MFYYPYDPRIHNFGNIGLRGAIHAEFAPIFTKLIDLKAYNKRDIRKEITDKLLDKHSEHSIHSNNYQILDLCCGVGFSTSEFGIDTSPQMINKAKRLFPDKKFFIANAEDFSNDNNRKFNAVTSMFSFHEMPMTAHEKIIENSMKLAKKEILIIDISPEYQSSQLMRSGEPYLLDYQKTIEKTMDKYSFERTDYIPGHVTVWKFDI